MTRTIRFFILGLSVFFIAAQAAKPQPTRLTIDRIMEGSDYSGTQPTEVRWSVDAKSVYFRWKKPADKKEALYVVSADGAAPRRLSEDEERLAPPATGVENEERTRKLFVDDGDIFV